MSFWSGLGKVALGVGCIACAPLAVGAAITTAATVGAVGIVGGIATEATVISAGMTAASVAEGSAVAIGSGIASKGIYESINS
ncbi:MAG: hypothetical protein LIR50_19310 [Bacillota bacterium]|nr:hypothetical protein [Bacillota bacterium]